MNGRRAGLTLFVAVLLAMTAYGVATTPQPRTAAQIGSADSFVCPLPQNVSGSADIPTAADRSAVSPRPAAGTVPTTFAPTSAVVCDTFTGDTVAADGTVSYFERHYSGDFGPVIEALNAPSSRPAWPIFCGTSEYSMPPLTDMWLIDADGRALEPTYPIGECGFDNTLGLYEIQSLTEISAVELYARLDPTAIDLLFNCPSALTTLPIPGPRSLLDLPIFASGFCRFDTTGPVPAFTGARTLDIAEPVLSQEVLADLPAATPCTETATSVVAVTVTDPATSDWGPVTIAVELDGCRRILGDGFIPIMASPNIVTALSSTG
ncbi:hypothetical protein [Rhodococcus sp. IEGM1428]|uniref:hypothetical protein n=1 Tax=Rhodococcus sp. IEGM1428 TaxID=3392191 RepID=UPI003D0E1B57